MQTNDKRDLVYIFWMKNYANCFFQIKNHSSTKVREQGSLQNRSQKGEKKKKNQIGNFTTPRILFYDFFVLLLVLKPFFSGTNISSTQSKYSICQHKAGSRQVCMPSLWEGVSPRVLTHVKVSCFATFGDERIGGTCHGNLWSTMLVIYSSLVRRITEFWHHSYIGIFIYQWSYQTLLTFSCFTLSRKLVVSLKKYDISNDHY